MDIPLLDLIEPRILFLNSRARNRLCWTLSGVGDLDSLLPLLKEHDVHMRISWDAVGRVNDMLRPVNPVYIKGEMSSGASAERTVRRCLEGGLSGTVQARVGS